LHNARGGISSFVGANVPALVKSERDIVSSTLNELIGHAAQMGSIYIYVRREAGTGIKDRIRFLIRKTSQGEGAIGPVSQALAPAGMKDEQLQRAKELAELWGASIDVEQLYENEWSIELSAEFETVTDPSGLKSTVALDGMRILVTISSEAERQIVANYLGSCGASIITAASNWEAVQLGKDSMEMGLPFDATLLEEESSWEKTLQSLDNLNAALAQPDNPSVGIVAMRGGTAAAQLCTASRDVPVISRPIRRSKLQQAAVLLCQAGEQTATLPPAVPGSSAPIAVAATTNNRSQLIDVAPLIQLGAHILIADDILINQEILRDQLSELGCTAEVVDNGLQAVIAFQSRKFDLILMDCQMPEMDGLTATNAIRKLEKMQKLPRTSVIGVSAHVFETERAFFLGGGMMDDFLCKPYSLDQLERCIVQALALTAAPPNDIDAGQTPMLAAG
jgi:two-component system sensor histidine kinase/response regulator